MMKHVQMLWLCVLIAGVISCAKTENQVAIESTPHLIDSLATLETVSLYKNLKKLVGVGLLFGHQETTAYGVGWTAEEARSDVKLVTGDFPAVYGWDIGREDQTRNVDGVPFTRVRQLIIEAYQRGGINTISWHVDNPTSLGSSWDTTRTVTHILPGGKDHEKFVQRLEYVADFLASCKVDDVYIPIIFRPFHEHN